MKNTDGKAFEKALSDWVAKVRNGKNRNWDFTTLSGDPIEMLYTPGHVNGKDFLSEIGFPGEYPYTRGIHPNMYRGRLWTMRQFSGFGTPRDSNERYHYLLNEGQTGLSVAFDMPTLMGYDSDHPRACGEVGRCGVNVSSLADMEILFDRIPLDRVSTSMTINGPAAMLYAFYICVGEKQGVDSKKLRGTIQNDILKEYIAQKEWLFPPKPSLRIITDIIEYSTQHIPLWNTISISGYHIREAGSTAAQELAFTLSDGFTYVEAALERGLDVDVIAERLSLFFNSHLDFFEEIAKFRAARRIWAKTMREKYGALDPRSWLMRFHTQTAGCSLTALQPENNITRTAFQALAAVLGGTQSLHTNSMDETHALPSEKAVTIALRTQQLIGYETGVANTIDPLGGSYFIETLTDRMEEKANEYFRKIDELGGVVAAIEQGFQQREIAKAAYRYQKEIEEKRKIVVGINDFIDDDQEIDIPILKIDPRVEEDQRRAVKKVRDGRDNERVRRCLNELRDAAKGTDNLMPCILEAARSYATLGEMVAVLKEVFGEYTEKPVF